jgi:L-iditol 2-dehydrogenase
MKAIVVRSIGEFSLEEVDRPKPGPREVIVRVEVAGFCRTDLKIVRHGHRDLLLPCIPGEEAVGIVEEVGPEVTRDLIGSPAYIYPGTSCGDCKECQKGALNLCREMKIMGFHRPGGFAEFVKAPVSSLIPIPEGLPFEEAVFAEPLSCCLNALEQAGLKEGETIGLWGAGPAGVLLSRAAAAMNARPTSFEPDPVRRGHFGALEAPSGESFDVCVVDVGSLKAYEEAFQCLLPRGRLVVFSGLLKGEEILPIDLNRVHYLEQTVVGAYGCSYRHGALALHLIHSKKVEVGDLITHRLSLEEFEKALELVEKRKCMKVLIYPNK